MTCGASAETAAHPGLSQVSVGVPWKAVTSPRRQGFGAEPEAMHCHVPGIHLSLQRPPAAGDMRMQLLGPAPQRVCLCHSSPNHHFLLCYSVLGTLFWHFCTLETSTWQEVRSGTPLSSGRAWHLFSDQQVIAISPIPASAQISLFSSYSRTYGYSISGLTEVFFSLCFGSFSICGWLSLEIEWKVVSLCSSSSSSRIL